MAFTVIDGEVRITDTAGNIVDTAVVSEGTALLVKTPVGGMNIVVYGADKYGNPSPIKAIGADSDTLLVDDLENRHYLRLILQQLIIMNEHLSVLSDERVSDLDTMRFEGI